MTAPRTRKPRAIETFRERRAKQRIRRHDVAGVCLYLAKTPLRVLQARSGGQDAH